MADGTPTRLGQINAAGDALALYLKVFPGEVINAFDELNIMMDKQVTRSITSGKSAQFPVTGKANAAYHTPGEQLLGTNALKLAEKIIYIDSLLTSDAFVANFDEAMTHFDIRGEYAHQMGEALARKVDEQLLRVVLLASRKTATITGESNMYGGTTITDSDADTNGASLNSSLLAARQTMDEKDVPDTFGESWVAVRPAQYYLLVEADKLSNRDFGGKADVSRGIVTEAGGFEILKTNRLPSATETVDAGVAAGNVYHGLFNTTVAAFWHRTAIGTVKLMDLATEKEYQVSRQGTLMVAKQAMGHGDLKPESAGEVRTAAPS
jgi:hypothetical protein